MQRDNGRGEPFPALRASWDYEAPSPYRPEDRVYVMRSILDDPRFKSLRLPGGDNAIRDAFERVRRNPSELAKVAKSWKAPLATGKVSTWNDCPMIGAYFPAFSQRAVKELRDLLESHGAILPLKHAGGKYFAFIPRPIKNVLDKDRSAIDWRFRIERMRDPRVLRYVFRTQRLAGVPIFSLPEVPYLTYVTDAFVQRVKEAGLMGFNFEIVFPLRSSQDWQNLALKNLRRHLSEGLPKGQSASGKRLWVQFKIANPNDIPTRRQERQIREWAQKVDDELHDPSSIKLPVGYVSMATPNTGNFTVLFQGPDVKKLLAKVRPMIRRAKWDGEVRVLKR